MGIDGEMEECQNFFLFSQIAFKKSQKCRDSHGRFMSKHLEWIKSIGSLKPIIIIIIIVVVIMILNNAENCTHCKHRDAICFVTWG